MSHRPTHTHDQRNERPFSAVRLVAFLIPLTLTAPLFAREAVEPDFDVAMAAYREALAAQEAGDASAYRDRLELAASRLPESTRLLYRLAGARLGAGDREGALSALEQQVDAGFVRDPRGDEAFAALADDADFLALMKRMDALTEPVVASEELFRLGEKDLLVEGIAHDPRNGTFFLSSVHRSKVLRRTADGTVMEFVPSGAHGLGAALGLAVDTERRLLWIVSAGLLHAAGLPEAARDTSALLAVDLDSGELRRKVDARRGKHLWNDLVLAADGTLFVSDPGSASIERVDLNGNVGTQIGGLGMVSPGGLALSVDGSLLYIADWSRGLALYDLRAGELHWLRPPANATVLGIDGLVRNGDTLIAIQNGISPNRITRFHLAADGRSLAAAELLERNVPGWDEPTLGVLVDGALLYVANSQWPRFPEDGTTPDAADLAEPVIRRLPLR